MARFREINQELPQKGNKANEDQVHDSHPTWQQRNKSICRCSSQQADEVERRENRHRSEGNQCRCQRVEEDGEADCEESKDIEFELMK